MRNPISIAGRPASGDANRYQAVVPVVVSTIGSHGLTTSSTRLRIQLMTRSWSCPAPDWVPGPDPTAEVRSGALRMLRAGGSRVGGAARVAGSMKMGAPSGRTGAPNREDAAGGA